MSFVPLVGGQTIASGDFEKAERETMRAKMLLRFGCTQLFVPLSGGREDREDVRAFWRKCAAALGVPFFGNGCLVVLGHREDAIAQAEKPSA